MADFHVSCSTDPITRPSCVSPLNMDVTSKEIVSLAYLPTPKDVGSIPLDNGSDP